MLTGKIRDLRAQPLQADTTQNKKRAYCTELSCPRNPHGQLSEVTYWWSLAHIRFRERVNLCAQYRQIKLQWAIVPLNCIIRAGSEHINDQRKKLNTTCAFEQIPDFATCFQL